MTVSGGVRTRLIKSAVQTLIETKLGELGWFDDGRQHRTVRFERKPVPWDEAIELTTIVVHTDDLQDVDLETGSDLTEDTHTFYADVYADKDSVGEHIAGDIRDILRGRMPQIGRTTSTVEVRDTRQPTPPLLTTLQLENIDMSRARNAPHAWQRHWFSVQFTLSDSWDVDNIDGAWYFETFDEVDGTVVLGDLELVHISGTGPVPEIVIAGGIGIQGVVASSIDDWAWLFDVGVTNRYVEATIGANGGSVVLYDSPTAWVGACVASGFLWIVGAGVPMLVVGVSTGRVRLSYTRGQVNVWGNGIAESSFRIQTSLPYDLSNGTKAGTGLLTTINSETEPTASWDDLTIGPS